MRRQPHFEATLVSLFAAAAVLLASLGIFGVVTCSTALRRKEMGIRVALEADRWNVFSVVMGEGLGPVLFGMIGGCFAAILMGGLLRSLLYGVEPNDLAAMAASGLLMTGAAMVG